MGSVEVEGFEGNLKILDVKKKAWSSIRKQHARELLEAHDEVLRAYYGALYDCQGPGIQHKHHVASNVYL